MPQRVKKEFSTEAKLDSKTDIQQKQSSRGREMYGLRRRSKCNVPYAISTSGSCQHRTGQRSAPFETGPQVSIVSEIYVE